MPRIETIPASHPYVTEITIDPADLRQIERMVEGARELRLLGVDDTTADYWTVRVGCASKRVREMFEDRWA